MIETQPALRAETMRRRGQFLLLDPDSRRLRRLLRTQRRTAAAESPSHVQHRTVPLWEHTTDMYGQPAIKCWAGLTLPLMGSGVQGGNGLNHAGLPVPETMPTACFDVAGFLDFIASHDRGLIHYPSEVPNPAAYLAPLAGAWPDLNITFVVSQKKKAIELRKHLRKHGIDAFAFETQNEYLFKPQVAVTTFQALPVPLEPQKQDIVVVIDAVAATSEQNLWRLGHLENARLYGMLPDDRRLAPLDENLVRSVFGFQEHRLARGSRRYRTVSVAWVSGEGRALGSEPTDLVALKRHGLWKNDARNRHIARIARAARDGSDLTDLLGRPAAALGPPGPASVLVIVENLEHALDLMPKLPGWPVIHQCSNFDRLDPAIVTELDRRIPDPTSSPGCAIATLTALANFDFRAGHFSIAILACGGSKLPDLPKNTFLEALDKPSPLLLVDMYDRHHRDLARASRKRQRAYRERGWAAPGRKPALQRACDFLNKRLGGRR